MLSFDYISESDAIEQIFKITGIQATTEIMRECAELGVIPAYMEFSPKDKENYPGDSFQLVGDIFLATVEPGELTTLHGTLARELFPLPFPLPKDGRITVAEDATYDLVRSEASVPDSFKVFVARKKVPGQHFEQLEEVSEQHFIRVYAPKEMRQAARNLEQYLAGRGCHPMRHSCCKSLSYSEVTIEVTSTVKSPFADVTDALIFNKRTRKDVSISGEKPPGKDMPCMRLVISAMHEMIYELRAELGKKLRNDEHLIEELQKILPEKTYRGMSEDSLKKSFAAASSWRDFVKKRYE